MVPKLYNSYCLEFSVLLMIIGDTYFLFLYLLDFQTTLGYAAVVVFVRFLVDKYLSQIN